MIIFGTHFEVANSEKVFLKKIKKIWKYEKKSLFLFFYFV